jgi:large subunit ribosomal protein L4
MSETRTVDVLDASGSKAGTADLPAELFDVTANVPLIHQVVVAQLAAARQGTHSTKTRGDVRGGGKKPYRQKGTGRARQGSTRAPQFVGGGVVHGPHPHGYSQRTPKKMIAAALRGALSDRARDGRVHVVSDLVTGDTPSTRTALTALATVAASPKVLVVLHRDDDLAWLSLRNAASVHAIAVDQLNAYDVLVNDEVVFTSSALAAYVAGPASGRSAKAVATSGEVAASDVTTPEVTASEVTPAELIGSEVAEPDGYETLGSAAEPSNAELAATEAVVAEDLEPIDPALVGDELDAEGDDK